MRVRVLLVDDHQMMREGLRSILADDASIELVGEAASGSQAVRLAAELRPDVVIMDVAMPDTDGIEATKQIKAEAEDVQVIALSSYAHRRDVMAILAAGAAGYVLKVGAYEDLRKAILAVRRGQRFLSPAITSIVVDESLGSSQAGARAADDAAGPDARKLARREREILAMIAQGLSSSNIAQRLELSPHTVDTHRRNLMRKLGLHNVADLTRFAIREGLTSADP